MFWRASVESCLSSLSLLITERRRGWWTDLQTDHRILLSSLFELNFSPVWGNGSFMLPALSFAIHPPTTGKRGTDPEEGPPLGLELLLQPRAVMGWWRRLSNQPDIPVQPLALSLHHWQSSGCLCLLPVTRATLQGAEKCRILRCQVRQGAATARASTGTTRLQPGSVSDRICAQSAPGVPPICRGPGNAGESSSATLLLQPFPNNPPPLFLLLGNSRYLVVLALNTFPHKHHSHNYSP